MLQIRLHLIKGNCSNEQKFRSRSTFLLCSKHVHGGMRSLSRLVRQARMSLHVVLSAESGSFYVSVFGGGISI